MDNFNPAPAPIPMRPVNQNPPWLKRLIIAVLAIILLITVAANSIYVLNSGHQAVITRFGAFLNTIETTGLQFKIPFIDHVDIVDTESIRRLEFGYRTLENGSVNDVAAEASMLTGDENLVLADWAILYRVTDSYNYLFMVNAPEATLRVIAESSYRRVVASHPLDDILTDQKDSIQAEIMTDLQKIADEYELGVRITAVQLQDAMPPDEVKDSFLDVSSAKEERSAKINEASKYSNEQLPLARGQAAQLVNQAEAYKQQRINEAEGSVARYAAIQAEFTKSPDITRTRLYLEMIQEVLPKVKQVYFVDANGDTLKVLPLNGNLLGG
ncbi:HflK protein [Clostridia bacterium]|nr:HflK protein [Clostridia bacterium]